MQVLLLRGASANSGVEVHTMSAAQFRDKVAWVNKLVLIRHKMVREDTSESLAAADLLTGMIEKAGREVTYVAYCYSSY